jgi:hypothetical protein
MDRSGSHSYETLNDKPQDYKSTAVSKGLPKKDGKKISIGRCESLDTFLQVALDGLDMNMFISLSDALYSLEKMQFAYLQSI